MSLSYPQDRTCPYQPPSGYLSTDGPVSRVTLYDGRAAWLVTGRAEIRTLLADPRVSADRTNLDFRSSPSAWSPSAGSHASRSPRWTL
ncbi:hypothetical protein [Kitasatospora sp. NPDC087315]|uniref:hypothetical protein n=1 Tax=Kitasatospora sp. NPDC087315 TaxID=3364069 RepID=UPI00381FD210